MGNVSEKEHSCDTLAREIKFQNCSDRKSKPAQSDIHRQHSMMKNKGGVYRMPVRSNSRSRKSTKKSSRGVSTAKSPATIRSQKFLLADMELECDGNVCR